MAKFIFVNQPSVQEILTALTPQIERKLAQALTTENKSDPELVHAA